MESGDPSFNIQVFGGDVVSVPRAGIVYVMGAGISQPGGYVLQSHGEQISVLKAIALAHGTTGFAKADDSVIMRNNPLTGQRDVIPVHIKQIEHRKAEDVVDEIERYPLHPRQLWQEGTGANHGSGNFRRYF